MTGRTIHVGTRKGLITLRGNGAGMAVTRVAFEGIPVAYAACDARTGRVWACLEHGHWGPKLHRSEEDGATFEELEPPCFPEDAQRIDGTADGEAPAATGIWCVTPGGDAKPERIWLGTFPGGLFRSDDGGESFALVKGLWEHAHRPKWFGGGRDTPGLHSILVDPRNADRVLVAISCGGVYETEDGGATWTPRNEGLAADFLPEPSSDVGQDPHCIAYCAADPDIVWQQNHCGVYRSTDAGRSWTDIGQKGGPVCFGFPIVSHPERPEVAWVVPAVSDEVRMAIGGALVVHRTDDAGKSWKPFTEGLPQENAYDVVYRHAFDGNGDELVFGSTTGNLFYSGDGGESWTSLGSHFPPIYSVRFG